MTADVCPNCQGTNGYVVRNWGIKHERFCPACRFRWQTVEVVVEAAQRQTFQLALSNVRERFRQQVDSILEAQP